MTYIPVRFCPKCLPVRSYLWPPKKLIAWLEEDQDCDAWLYPDLFAKIHRPPDPRKSDETLWCDVCKLELTFEELKAHNVPDLT